VYNGEFDMTIKNKMNLFLRQLQNDICSGLESVDSVSFEEDTWERPGGGGGQTRVIGNGNVFEKGGVNVSEVLGPIQDKEKPMFKMLLEQQGIDIASLDNASFYATGLSLVIHPKSPFIPTTHANYRYFELKTADKTVWWFGGGADLTPYYLDTDDATHFHLTHKTACDKHDKTYYPKFKKKCDTYFTITHRNETRGIGGIFFDYLNHDSQETLFKFVQDCGNAFIPAYLPLVEKHMGERYTEQNRYWQEIRRGRYAEFNLIYDRGTLFGLKTNGRVESIMMSLPPVTRWDYCHEPKPNSKESELISVLQNSKEWV
jgi:coproporphyrinogen III oxidase